VEPHPPHQQTKKAVERAKGQPQMSAMPGAVAHTGGISLKAKRHSGVRETAKRRRPKDLFVGATR